MWRVRFDRVPRWKPVANAVRHASTSPSAGKLGKHTRNSVMKTHDADFVCNSTDGGPWIRLIRCAVRGRRWFDWPALRSFLKVVSSTWSGFYCFFTGLSLSWDVFTGFYRVLPGYISMATILLSFARFYCNRLGSARCYQVWFTFYCKSKWFNWLDRVFTGFYWVILELRLFYWVLLGFTAID